uniref:Uncharacterized protein n=1 Tax=Gossypium raimondii TaxID=29730 RepID=A0A0D2PQK4_GOSRA|nr:hypothetical protein B456_001G209700 [Gossypium raimondii]
MTFAPITPIGCNSHSPHSAPIRDFIHVSYFLFHFLPSSTSSSQTFLFHIASLTGRYITLLAARTLPLFILQILDSDSTSSTPHNQWLQPEARRSP